MSSWQVRDQLGDDELPGPATREDFEIVQCLGCESASFRKVYWDEVTEMDTVEFFPSRVAGRLPLRSAYNLPKTVRAIYREAIKAMGSEQPILAGIGIRALVEAVCQHEQATGPSLEKRIDDLADKGILTRAGAEILHKTRLLGNKAAHEITAPSPEDLSAAMDVAEHVLQTVLSLEGDCEALAFASSEVGA
jgi:hypothetical protein